MCLTVRYFSTCGQVYTRTDSACAHNLKQVEEVKEERRKTLREQLLEGGY